jgi:hypothetical protein
VVITFEKNYGLFYSSLDDFVLPFAWQVGKKMAVQVVVAGGDAWCR